MINTTKAVSTTRLLTSFYSEMGIHLNICNICLHSWIVCNEGSAQNSLVVIHSTELVPSHPMTQKIVILEAKPT